MPSWTARKNVTTSRSLLTPTLQETCLRDLKLLTNVCVRTRVYISIVMNFSLPKELIEAMICHEIHTSYRHVIPFSDCLMLTKGQFLIVAG